MTKSENKMRLPRIILEIVVLLLSLLAIGVLVQHRMNELLHTSLEHSIAKTSKHICGVVAERMTRELAMLRQTAESLSSIPEEADGKFISMQRNLPTGVTIGWMRLDGSAIYGEALWRERFSDFPLVFRGNEVISYRAGHGLIFAVPVLGHGNVQSVIWRLFDDTVLEDVFGLSEHGEAFLFLQERNSYSLPRDILSAEELTFLETPAIADGYDTVRDQLALQKSAAVLVDSSLGKHFLFGVNLAGSECVIMGHLPYAAVVGDISRIYDLLIKVGALVLGLFAMVSIWLIVMHSRAEQNEILSREKSLHTESMNSKSTFLAGVSHDIRTPINVIMGMNEMILRKTSDAEIISYAHGARRAGESLIALVDDVFDLTYMESSGFRITEKPYRTVSLISDAVTMIKPEAIHKGLHFILDVDRSLPRELVGDCLRIQQIAVNLLSNAVKYTEKGHVTFRVAYEPLDRERITFIIEVRDTGIGIHEDDRSKLFHSFQRLDPMKNRHIDGTGLGLVITSELVQRMQGRIDVKSVYGQGSVFTVRLPQKIVDVEPIASKGKRPPLFQKVTGSLEAEGAHVLVVDDNELNLLLTRHLLERTKMHVDTCLSGQEALEKLAAKPYDVVLLDYMMPMLDGAETLRRARVLPNCRKTPFIAFTADATEESRKRLLAEGFADLLTKPVDGAKLEAMLARFVSGASGRTQLQPMHEPVLDEVELDISLGLDASAGSREIYQELASMFVKQNDEKKRALENAFLLKDWREYAVLVHALKSSAISVGGRGLARIVEKLENATRELTQQNLSPESEETFLTSVYAHHETLMRYCDELAKRLTEFVDKDPSSRENQNPE
ncbi:MAG: response regulator [Desulfovibrio sp.]|nr:response regulator [Desulfovibrio sp.]